MSNKSNNDNMDWISALPYKGCYSNSVMELPLQLCDIVRPVIYREKMGVAWPFHFDKEEAILELQEKLPLSIIDDDLDLPVLCFSAGCCAENTSLSSPICVDGNIVNSPVIVTKLNKKTSQGKIYIANFKAENPDVGKPCDIRVVVKTDNITKRTKNLWTSSSAPKYISGRVGMHTVISEAYMDAMCSILLSNLVEQQISPHFPVCYGTTVASTKIQRKSKNKKNNNKNQVIWMEYLPCNIYRVIADQSDYRLWWSALFQISAALISAQYHYGIVHNDLHGHNIRIRKVPYDTMLYYVDAARNYYCVPTYGFVYVLIDFGRSFIWLKNKEGGYVSSVFTGNGACSDMEADNLSFDLVRFVISVEDKLFSVENPEQRKALSDLFAYICKTDNDVDILKSLLFMSEEDDMEYYIDELPRTICHNGNPYSILPVFHQLYGQLSVPADIVPFELSPK